MENIYRVLYLVGIAHEIGHNINQGSYAIAEITNNYFSLSQNRDSNDTTRFNIQMFMKSNFKYGWNVK